MKRFYHIHYDSNTGRQVIFDGESAGGFVTAFHEQTEAAEIWTLEHGRETNKLVIQVHMDNGDVAVPQIKIQDLNTIAITFSEPTTGSVVIIFFD